MFQWFACSNFSWIERLCTKILLSFCRTSQEHSLFKFFYLNTWILLLGQIWGKISYKNKNKNILKLRPTLSQFRLTVTIQKQNQVWCLKRTPKRELLEKFRTSNKLRQFEAESSSSSGSMSRLPFCQRRKEKERRGEQMRTKKRSGEESLTVCPAYIFCRFLPNIPYIRSIFLYSIYCKRRNFRGNLIS